MPRRWKKGDKITPETVQDCMDIIARAVALPGGEVYVPLYLRLEREVASLKEQQDALTRIRARARALAVVRAQDACPKGGVTSV